MLWPSCLEALYKLCQLNLNNAISVFKKTRVLTVVSSVKVL